MSRTGSGRFITGLVGAGALLAMGGIASAETPTVDPCKFLTPAEVESVMGKTLKGGPQLGNLYAGVEQSVDEKTRTQAWACGYEFTTSESLLVIGVIPWEMLGQRPELGSSEQVKVNGLGDEAVLDRRRFQDWASLSLHIRRGKLAMLLEILDDTAGDEEKLKVLGKKAVGRW